MPAPDLRLVSQGPGLRALRPEEKAEQRRHFDTVAELANQLMDDIAVELTREAGRDGCVDANRLVDIAARASVVASDVRAYLDDNDYDDEGPVRCA